MKKLLQRAALTVTSLGLSVGMAGVAAADTSGINTTGPDSNNVISCNVDETYTLNNNNSVDATSYNGQNASTGTANTSSNTNGGGATSGSASNSSSNNTSVSVSNGGSSAAAFGGAGGGSSAMTNNTTISDTGPRSTNQVRYDVNRTVKVTNNNDLSVESNSNQTSTTGNSNVSDNTNAGSANSGSASNSNTTTSSVSVSN